MRCGSQEATVFYKQAYPDVELGYFLLTQEEVIARKRGFICGRFPRFYDVYQEVLDRQEATARAKETMMEMRKALDKSLLLAYNRMAEMEEVGDDAIVKLRGKHWQCAQLIGVVIALQVF